MSGYLLVIADINANVSVGIRTPKVSGNNILFTGCFVKKSRYWNTYSGELRIPLLQSSK